MIEVVVTDEFKSWFMELNEKDATAVEFVVGLLEKKGVHLGFPYSSHLLGAGQPLRELRIQSQGRPLQVCYAFDPQRSAVLLLGGDKTGDKRFYQKFAAQSEKIWTQYLQEQGWI